MKDEEAFGYARIICKLLNLDGNIGFDFIRTEDGLKLFEINPRVTIDLIRSCKGVINVESNGARFA